MATLTSLCGDPCRNAITGHIRVRIAYTPALTFAHRYQEAKLVLATLNQNNGDLGERSRDETIHPRPVYLLV